MRLPVLNEKSGQTHRCAAALPAPHLSSASAAAPGPARVDHCKGGRKTYWCRCLLAGVPCCAASQAPLGEGHLVSLHLPHHQLATLPSCSFQVTISSIGIHHKKTVSPCLSPSSAPPARDTANLFFSHTTFSSIGIDQMNQAHLVALHLPHHQLRKVADDVERACGGRQSRG